VPVGHEQLDVLFVGVGGEVGGATGFLVSPEGDESQGQFTRNRGVGGVDARAGRGCGCGVGDEALAALGGRIGKNTICYQIALVFAALATVGTWLGSLANQAVSADLLMYAFALLLICVGLVMLRRAYPPLGKHRARGGRN